MIKNNTLLGLQQWASQLKYLPLASYALESPVWIYQSSRHFTNLESTEIKGHLDDFTGRWLSHGDKVDAFGDLLFNRFVVLSANAAKVPPSGCSIDSSVHFLQALEDQYSTDMFNRMQIAFLDQEGELDTFPLHSAKEMLAEGTILPNTPIFDNTVTTSGHFIDGWIKPVEKSWIKRFL